MNANTFFIAALRLFVVACFNGTPQSQRYDARPELATAEPTSRAAQAANSTAQRNADSHPFSVSTNAHGYRGEFIRLVELTQSFSETPKDAG